MKPMFWIRWSLRDLRQRWVQVLAIAMISALGTGTFAGLGSQRQWREDMYDKNFTALNMYDLRITFTEGSYIDQAAIENTLAAVDGIRTAEERLILPTLVDASTKDETILVTGRLIGVETTNDGPTINQIYIHNGEGLTVQNNRTNAVVVVDYLFARYYDLNAGDSIKIAGNTELDFVGTGQSPEYFQIIPPDGGFLSEDQFAVLYMSLARLQTLYNLDGKVNDVVILIEPNADREAVRAGITAAFANNPTLSNVGYEIMNKEDDANYRRLYDDAKGDQEMISTVAFMMLFGAGMAAFSLISRIMQSQRRQMGIGMALGVKRHWLALRPLLMGLEIAFVGTIFGLGVGYLFSVFFTDFFTDFIPLPYEQDSFYLSSYVVGTLLGILVPTVATLYPVWQAVRVKPIDAIKTGTLVSKRGGVAPFIQNIPLPGRSFMQMPLRNLLRAPWRTMLTVFGISIAILLMITMVGLLDTFDSTIDGFSDAYLYKNEDRLTIVFDQFYPSEDGIVGDVATATTAESQPLFKETSAGLMLEGNLIHNSEKIPVALELMDMANPIWLPQLTEGDLPIAGEKANGIVISEKAAKDLNVHVGDTITLSHPQSIGAFAFQIVETPIEVVGIHNNPLRNPSYLNLNQAERFGMTGLVNYMMVNPETGIDTQTVKQSLFGQDGIALVQSMDELPKSFERGIAILRDILQLVQVVVLFLAFLIAFNSTSINVDERVREIATMFAFGLRIRTVTRMQIIENVVMGIIGTVLGLVFGYIFLSVLFGNQLADLFPDIQFNITIYAVSMLIAGVLGVIVVSLTPLLSIRRMMKMDIPSTLRVME